jgi:hypothetical protein
MLGPAWDIQITLQSPTGSILCTTLGSIEPPIPPNVDRHRIRMRAPSSKAQTPVGTESDTRARDFVGVKYVIHLDVVWGNSKRCPPMSLE